GARRRERQRGVGGRGGGDLDGALLGALAAGGELGREAPPARGALVAFVGPVVRRRGGGRGRRGRRRRGGERRGGCGRRGGRRRRGGGGRRRGRGAASDEREGQGEGRDQPETTHGAHDTEGADACRTNHRGDA